MPSRKNGKLQYLQGRSANTLWLPSQRRFSVFLQSLKREAYFQAELLRRRLRYPAKPALQSRSGRDSPGSADDAFAGLPARGSRYIDSRKLAPRGYRPTTLKRADAMPMHANPEEVKHELGRILSSLNERERS